MNQVIKIFLIFLFILFTNIVIATEEERNIDPDNTENVVLKPQIKISSIPTVQYEIDLYYLKPFFERVLIVEDPNLQTIITKSKKPVPPNSKSIVALPNIKQIFSSKKTKKQPTDLNKRYVVGLEKKSFTMAGIKDRIFAAGLEEDNYYNYVFVEKQDSYYHPETNEYLGTEMFIIGQGTVMHRDKISLIEIETAKQAIKPGTLIMPTRSLVLSEKLQANTPDKKLKGYILSVIPGVKYGVSNSSVIVSVGSRDGAKVGDLLKVKNKDLVLQDPYKSSEKHILPAPTAKGELVLYDVFDKLSIGLIIKSVEEIKVLDQAE